MTENDRNVDFCRGCMTSNDLIEFSNNLRYMFTACTSIQITDNDDFTSLVCAKCENDIHYCYKFINRCKQTDNELKKIFPSVSRSVNVKEESFIDYNTDSNNDGKEMLYVSAEYLSIKEEDALDKGSGTSVGGEYSNDPRSAKKTGSIASRDRLVKKTCRNLLEKSHGRKKKKRVLSKTIKSSVKCYTCPLCHKTFGEKIKFKNHLSKEHDEHKKFLCSVCSKRFSSQKHLEKHQLSHTDEKSSFCKICNKSYKHPKSHNKIHTDIKPYKCDICDLSFTVKGYLKNHEKTHDEMNRFLCDLCGMDFTRKGNLKIHMRVHTGEKPYACSHCAFRCSVKSALRRHEVQHSDVRPHACDVCQRSFKNGSSLIRHKRIHSGELPYKCAYCTMAFIDSWKRKIHLVKSHNILLTDIPRMSAGRKRTTVGKSSDGNSALKNDDR